MFVFVFSATLVALGFVTRLPFHPRYLSSPDEIQFALGSHDFDIAKFRPHPPGYTLFVGLLRVLGVAIHNDNLRLVFLGAAASCLSAVLLFLLALRLFEDRRMAVFSSVLWLTNPVLWFSSEIGSIYSTGALASIGTAYFVARLWQRPTERAAILAGGALAVAAGLRQDQLLFLLPVWIFPAVRSSACRRLYPLAAIVFVAGYVTWYIPTVAHAGGFVSYSSLVRRQFLQSAEGTSIFFGAPVINHGWMLLRLASSLLTGLLPFWLLIPVLGWEKDGNSLWNALNSDGRVRFLLIWALPSLAFLATVHFAKSGYALTCLPAITLLVSRLLYGGTRLHRVSLMGFSCIVLLAAIANGVFFFFAPRLEQPSTSGPVGLTSPLKQLLPRILNQTILETGYVNIRLPDQVIAAYIAEFSRRLAQGPGAIIFISTNSPGLCPLNWRSLMYSFPGAPVLSIVGLDDPKGEGASTILYQLGFETKENVQTLHFNTTALGEVLRLSSAGRRSALLLFPSTLSAQISVTGEAAAVEEVVPKGGEAARLPCRASFFSGFKSISVYHNLGGRSILFAP
jgi:hypothetical protein